MNNINIIQNYVRRRHAYKSIKRYNVSIDVDIFIEIEPYNLVKLFG